MRAENSGTICAASSLRRRSACSAARWEGAGAEYTTLSLMLFTARAMGSGATMLPTRKPVITKFLLKLLMATVRSFMPGSVKTGKNGSL